MSVTGNSSTAPGPVVPLGGRKSGNGHVNIKVLQATLKKNASGRAEFSVRGQIYVDIIETTANVTYINHVIKQEWGREFTLVSADGLKIEDGSGTQGMLRLCTIFVLWAKHCF